MTKFAAIAYRCLHNDREKRPAMDVVAKELEEALRSLGRSQWEGWKVLGHPQQWRTYPMNRWFPKTKDIGSVESFQYKGVLEDGKEIAVKRKQIPRMPHN
ncbi:hypothetical protein Tco_0102191, partial [Tanacetum coccineum]